MWGRGPALYTRNCKYLGKEKEKKSETEEKERNTYCKCAAKALFSCPAIISQRLESRIISKEPQENTEEELKII